MKYRMQNMQNTTKVENRKPRSESKRWEPYADMGYQTSPYANGLVKCYITTKKDSEDNVVTIRDKDGNTMKMSDVEFVKSGGQLRVLRYKKDDGTIVECGGGKESQK